MAQSSLRQDDVYIFKRAEHFEIKFWNESAILLTLDQSKLLNDKLSIMLYRETLKGAILRNNIMRDKINYWKEVFAESVLNGSQKWAYDYVHHHSEVLFSKDTVANFDCDVDEEERILYLFEAIRK